MRKATLLLAGTALALLPAASWATIVGSPHDFTAKSWNARASLCGPCHQVHNTDPAQLIPLWTHRNTTASFTPYSSGTLQASVGQPDGSSKACLSCHDGTVAVNDYGGNVQGNTPEYIPTDARIGAGGDLHTTHPISFVYDAALASRDGFLQDPTTTTVPLLGNKTIDQGMLQGHKLQCSSCHDVHKQKGTSATSGIMVVIGGSAGAGSLLCRTCHIK